MPAARFRESATLALGALAGIAGIALAACTLDASMKKDNPTLTAGPYPETRQDASVVDDYAGTRVADPYRWLEDDRSDETAAWVAAQNAVTRRYLDAVPYREALHARYAELFDYPKLSSPTKAGEHYFFYKNDGLQNQYVIYRQRGLDGEPEVFLDANAANPDGTTTFGLAGFSGSKTHVAYTRSDAGSDWQNLMVREVATGRELGDTLRWVKFSGASWLGDEGFFYSRYPEPAAGDELSGNNQYHSVYFHRLGTPQADDQLVWEDRARPEMYHFGGVTEDERYFVMYAAPGTDGYATYLLDLDAFRQNPSSARPTELFAGYANKSSVVDHRDGRLLVLTDVDAPNYRLVSVDPRRPDPADWTEVIPETEHLLESVSTVGGGLVATYLERAANRVYRFAYDGTGRAALELPGIGSVGGFGGERDDRETFYTFTSFVYPPTIFRYDLATGESEVFYETELKFDPRDYEERQVTYASADGTPVTMFLVHRKGIARDSARPTLLYGYGGFNVSLSPSFSTSRLLLLEQGGVFAMPNLRGGGEYGEAWHQGGMLARKQNVFDDFIAAAEYLVAEGYTAPEHLAIQGGSNGGLLVGAAMTQRPELFAVALPAVGVMDMLRYHRFTVGKGWIPEYGSADDPEMFPVLRAYSPLHNLKDGVAYPATLVTTADHDDRVVPAHSFKFAARLQAAHAGEAPVLIRIETDAGHGAGKPTSKIIDEQADLYSFLLWNTGVRALEEV